MSRFVIRRLLLAVPVLLGVSLLTFLILRLTPGDPARIMLGPEARPEDVEALRHALGLDRPLAIQYGLYLGRLLRGDLGVSTVSRQPVAALIGERLAVTLTLAAASLCLAVVAAVPLGVLAALHRGRLADRLITVMAVVGVASPTFWIGLVLIFFVSYKAQWLPATGWASLAQDGLAAFARHAALPSVTLAVGLIALIGRMVRSSMLEVLSEEFIRTAVAKGVGRWRLVFVHALRNALLPVVTVIGLQLGSLLGGAVVTETVFALPGLGRLAVDAINARDFPVLQGVVLVGATGVMAANLAVDLLYARLDPRVSVQ